MPLSRPDTAVAELVAAHVAGRLPPPLDAVVASHVALSPNARRFALDLAALAGRAVEATPPTALADRDAALARIFAADPAPVVLDPPSIGGDLPAPLARWAEGRRPTSRRAGGWRRIWFGIEQRDLGEDDGFACGLMRIAGGRRVPEHGHGGLEATLVLAGGFSDLGTGFGPGDLHVCDETIEHAPTADPEGCLCVFAIAGRGVVPSHPLGRLWVRAFG